VKLTDAKVKALRGQTKRFIQWDEGSGLGVRVSPVGRKSFIFMYRYEKTAKMMTLGSYPKLNLAEARTKAAKAKEEVSKGKDPGKSWVEKKREDRKSPTVEGLVDEYLEKWAKPRKRTWKEDERVLYKDVVPVIGRKKAKDIKRRDVVLILDSVVDRGSPASANKTYEIIRKMFNFAVARSILKYSPCAGIEKPSESNARDRILDEKEIQIFWEKLEEIPTTEGTKLAFKLLLVLGQRRGETTTAEWKEFDLKKGWWTIPSEKTKNKKTHRVPLTSLAIEFLLEAKELACGSRWVFPGLSEDKSLNPGTISQAIRKNREIFGIDHWTGHDLRRSVASYMGELGVDEFHISKVLNHTTQGVTSKHYNRHTYDPEKRQALETWERKLKSILTGKKAKVVNLKR